MTITTNPKLILSAYGSEDCSMEFSIPLTRIRREY